MNRATLGCSSYQFNQGGIHELTNSQNNEKNPAEGKGAVQVHFIRNEAIRLPGITYSSREGGATSRTEKTSTKLLRSWKSTVAGANHPP